MGKYRGLFILLSAVIWAVLLWGMSKVKPGVFEEMFDDIAIKVQKDKPKEPPKPPPPPPPPPPDTPKLVERKTLSPITIDVPDPVERVVVDKTPPPPEPIKEVSPPTPPPPPPPYVPPPPPPPSCAEKDTPPVRTTAFNTDGAYPARALEDEIEGSANVTAQVSASGSVTSVSISASNPVFNAASVAAEAKRQKYKPARRDCENVAGTHSYTVKFQLN